MAPSLIECSSLLAHRERESQKRQQNEVLKQQREMSALPLLDAAIHMLTPIEPAQSEPDIDQSESGSEVGDPGTPSGVSTSIAGVGGRDGATSGQGGAGGRDGAGEGSVEVAGQWKRPRWE